MLIINKNTVNDLYVTVTDRTTLSSPNYLMSLYNNDNRSKKVVRFTANTSTNIERVDIFELTETTSANEDLENGWINLNSGSTYDYTIYETSATTGTSISNLSAVETGLLKVSGSTVVGNVSKTFENSNDIVTFGD